MTEMAQIRRAPPWCQKEKESQEMEYQEAVRNNIWGCERDLADKVMRYVKQNNLKFKLDKLTRGQGNCYPVAVLQQLRRKEIFQAMAQDLKEAALNLDHMKLRKMVVNYIIGSKDVKIRQMHENYIQSMCALADMGEATMTWQQYWYNMLNDKS